MFSVLLSVHTQQAAADPVVGRALRPRMNIPCALEDGPIAEYLPVVFGAKQKDAGLRESLCHGNDFPVISVQPDHRTDGISHELEEIALRADQRHRRRPVYVSTLWRS